MGANREYLEALGIDWRTYEPPPHEKWEPPFPTAPKEKTKEDKQTSPFPESKPKRAWKKYVKWAGYAFLVWFAWYVVTAPPIDDPKKPVNGSVVDQIVEKINDNFHTMMGNLDEITKMAAKNTKLLYDHGKKFLTIERRLSTLEGRILNVDPATYALIKKFYEEPLPPGYQRTLTLKGCKPVEKKLPLRRN